MADGGVETVTGKSATIRFNGRLCIHARRCVLSQPTVFKANVEGPWIDPDAASAEALHGRRLELSVRGDSRLTARRRRRRGQSQGQHDLGARERAARDQRRNRPGRRLAGTRATLCRCGASKNKPYCDGSHVAAAFAATGEPATTASVAARQTRWSVGHYALTRTDRSASPAQSRSFLEQGARSTASKGPRSAAAGTPGESRIATALTLGSGSSRPRRWNGRRLCNADKRRRRSDCRGIMAGSRA